METLHSCISWKDFTNFEGNPYAGDGDVTLLATSEARGWQVMIIWWWFALFWWPSLSGWTLKVNPLLKKKLKLLQKWCFKVPLGKPTRGQRGLEEGGSWPNLLSKQSKKNSTRTKLHKKMGWSCNLAFCQELLQNMKIAEQANNLLYPATKPVALWHQTEMFARTKAKNRLPKGRLCFAHLLHCEEPSMGPLMPKDQETKLNFFVKLDNPDL